MKWLKWEDISSKCGEEGQFLIDFYHFPGFGVVRFILIHRHRRETGSCTASGWQGRAAVTLENWIAMKDNHGRMRVWSRISQKLFSLESHKPELGEGEGGVTKNTRRRVGISDPDQHPRNCRCQLVLCKAYISLPSWDGGYVMMSICFYYIDSRFL